ncbi:MAG: hypothetical protein ACTSUV_04875 [Candidatus Ranarchaeia archaeon]
MGNGTHNSTYSVTELMHFPFYSLNGTNGGGSVSGYWGGLLLRDLVVPFVDGAWEYVVECRNNEGISKNLSYEIVTRNDTLVAFWLDSDWLDKNNEGYLCCAPLSISEGSSWVKNLSYLRVWRTNTSVPAGIQTLEINAYRDEILSWDGMIHQGFRQVKYGSIKSPARDYGYYTGVVVKDFLTVWVGPWLEYDVTIITTDGFIANWTWDEVVSNDNYMICYGLNGTTFRNLGFNYDYRMMSLNDTSVKASQRSAYNLSKIIVTPTLISPDFDINLTFEVLVYDLDDVWENRTCGVGLNYNFTVFFDSYDLTMMDYFEGPSLVYNNPHDGPTGMYILKGVNLNALISEYVYYNGEIVFYFLEINHFINVSRKYIVNNSTHVSVLAWEVDGGVVDRTHDNQKQVLLFSMLSFDTKDIPVNEFSLPHIEHILFVETNSPSYYPPVDNPNDTTGIDIDLIPYLYLSGSIVLTIVVTVAIIRYIKK